jgi:hypothetical protein
MDCRLAEMALILSAGQFANNAASGVLRKDHPNSVHHCVLVMGGISYWGLDKASHLVLSCLTACRHQTPAAVSPPEGPGRVPGCTYAHKRLGIRSDLRLEG